MNNTKQLKREEDLRLLSNNFKVKGVFKGYSHSPEITDGAFMVIRSEFGDCEVLMRESDLLESNLDILEEGLIAGKSTIEVVGKTIPGDDFISFIAKKITVKECNSSELSKFVFTGTIVGQEPIISKGRPAMLVSGLRTETADEVGVLKSTKNLDGVPIDFIDEGHLTSLAIGQELRLEGDLVFTENSVEFYIRKAGSPKALMDAASDFADMWEGYQNYNEWVKTANVEEDKEGLLRLAFIYLENMRWISNSAEELTIKNILHSRSGGGVIIFANAKKHQLLVSVAPDMLSVSSLGYKHVEDSYVWQMSFKKNMSFNELIRDEPGVKKAIADFLES